MTFAERLWRGEFVNPSTALGAGFYALVFLIAAVVLARGIRLAFARLDRRVEAPLGN